MKQALHDKIGALLHLDANRSYKVLDLGCGRGELLAHLSTSMNPRSALVGIDESEDAIRTARNNYRSIEFLQQKLVDTLGFDDDSVDIVISVDVLECIPDRSALIDEVFRILKPGGTVLFAHWDWDTQVYNSEHKAIIRTFVAAFSDWQQDWMDASDGRMGRRLWGLFEGSGKFNGAMASFTLLETEYAQGRYGFDRLDDLSSLVAAGSIDPAEYAMIRREMQSLNEKNQYFYSVNSYLYVGEPDKQGMQSGGR